MADVSSVVLAAAIIMGAHTNLPDDELTTSFEASCTAGRWEENCPAWRSEIEVRLYNSLHTLYLQGEPLDRAQLRVAIRAKFGRLAQFALNRLGEPQSPEDMAAVTAALDHSSRAVRVGAKNVLEHASDAWHEGVGRWWLPTNSGWLQDTVPDMALYDLPALNDPQLRYRFMASGDRRAVYTTKLSPEKVLDLIAKGKPVVTGDKLGKTSGQVTPKQALVDQQKEFMAITKQIQEAAARGDYKTMQALGERMKALQGGLKQSAKEMQDTTGMEPVTAFSVEPSQVRYVNLGDRRSGGRLIAAVGQDDAWGETVVVVTLPY